MYWFTYDNSVPRLECDECGVITFDFSRLGEIHHCGRQGAFRLVSPAGQSLEVHDPLPHHNID